jgi:hypothetical protein
MRPKKRGRSPASRSVQTQPGGLFTHTWNRPSDLIADVMEGRTLISEVPASIQSAVKFHVYEIARGILQINKNLRKEALYKLPEAVQPLVEAEVRRLYVYAAQRR